MVILNPEVCWEEYRFNKIIWYEDPDEIRDMYTKIYHYGKYNGALDFDHAGITLSGMLKDIVRENPSSRNYVYTCSSTYMFTSRKNVSRPYLICEEFKNNIVYSEIGKYIFGDGEDDQSGDITFVERTGGKRWICEGDMVKKVYEHIMGTLPEVTEGGEGGDIPIPSGGEGGENGEDEPEDDPEKSENQKTPYAIMLLTEWNVIGLNTPIEVDGLTDTDEDELTDWEEADQSKITYDFIGTITLPTLRECLEDDQSIIKNGLERYKESMNPLYDKILDFHVLPILSNPVKKDSDGDELEDLHDPVKLSYRNHCDYYVNIEEKRQVDLIQDCLVSLKYLDIDERSYGRIGGLTKAAIILYQRNHRLNTDFGHFYYTIMNDNAIYTGISIDTVTLYSIILDAMNHGYELGDDVLLGDYYASEIGSYFEQRYIPQAIPLEKINVSIKDDITLYVESRIMKAESADGDSIYVYDYTEPIEQMLQYGAKEFHDHHYICNAFESVNDNTIKKYYIDSDKRCIKTGDDYCWLISKVAGEMKYDIKNGERWKEFFAEIGLEVPFGHQKIPFYYKDELLNAENLGNFLYGYVGHAADYSEDELLSGGSIYSILDNGNKDDEEDRDWISYGYNQYSSKDGFYEYVH